MYEFCERARRRPRALRQGDRGAATSPSCRASTSSSAAGARTACRACAASTPTELREIEPHAAGVARAALAGHRHRGLRAASRARSPRSWRSAAARDRHRRRGDGRVAGRRPDRARDTRAARLRARFAVFCAGRLVGPAGGDGGRARRAADRAVPRRLPTAAARAARAGALADLPGARPEPPVPGRAPHPPHERRRAGGTDGAAGAPSRARRRLRRPDRESASCPCVAASRRFAGARDRDLGVGASTFSRHACACSKRLSA